MLSFWIKFMLVICETYFLIVMGGTVAMCGACSAINLAQISSCCYP